MNKQQVEFLIHSITIKLIMLTVISQIFNTTVKEMCWLICHLILVQFQVHLQILEKQFKETMLKGWQSRFLTLHIVPKLKADALKMPLNCSVMQVVKMLRL